MAVMKASSIVSRATAAVSGSASRSGIWSSSASGYGSSQATSAGDPAVAACRRRLRMTSVQAFVAIRYSHARRLLPG